jgi:hypothetical protein
MTIRFRVIIIFNSFSYYEVANAPDLWPGGLQISSIAWDQISNAYISVMSTP